MLCLQRSHISDGIRAEWEMESYDEDRQPLPKDWQRSEHATWPAKRPHGTVQRDDECLLRNYVCSLFCNIYQCTQEM